MGGHQQKVADQIKSGGISHFVEFLKYVQENDLMVAGSMADVKGDRSKKPGQQKDPDLFVHIVERREDGIVSQGAKAHQTGMVNSHEMLILPTANLGAGSPQAMRVMLFRESNLEHKKRIARKLAKVKHSS